MSREGKALAWQVQNYTGIDHGNIFRFMNFFADDQQNRQLPGADRKINFSETGDHTTVNNYFTRVGGKAG